MAIGRTNAGGGGMSLNFMVVGSNAAPGNPDSNVIWVKTDYKINGWEFLATEPISPIDGMIWFPIGTSSVVGFNALKKNVLQVYPLAAKQYRSGRFENVDAFMGANGAWVQFSSTWDGYLYNNGDQIEDITGGWIAYPNDRNYVIFNSDNIQFVNGDNTASAAAIYTKNAIDISGYRNLTAMGTVTDFDGNDIRIGITQNNTAGYNPTFVASIDVSETGVMNATVDISGVSAGMYYASVWSKYSNFKITGIKLS